MLNGIVSHSSFFRKARRKAATLLGGAAIAALALPSAASAQDSEKETGDAPAPVAAPANGKQVYTPADFARFTSASRRIASGTG
jgi:hypothetical protein